MSELNGKRPFAEFFNFCNDASFAVLSFEWAMVLPLPREICAGGF